MFGGAKPSFNLDMGARHTADPQTADLEMPPADVLVTGATGKIGGGARKLLEGAGLAVRLFVRDRTKAAEFRAAGANVVIGTFYDQHRLRSACENIDTVLLVPPDADVAGADLVVEAAKNAGVRRIVRISAQGAAPRSPSALLRAHQMGEAKLEASGLKFTHLRANSFLQNIEFFSEWIVKLGAIFACRSAVRVSWIDARDVAAAASAAVISREAPNGVHTLNGPQALNGFEIARAIGERLDRMIACIDLGGPEFIETVMRNGWGRELAVEWAAMFTDDYYGSGRAAGSDEDLVSLIGAPPRRLRDYLADADWLGGKG